MYLQKLIKTIFLIYIDITDTWIGLDDYANFVHNNITSLHLVYFRLPKNNFELIIGNQLSPYQYPQPLINVDNMNEEDEFYWNSLCKIVKINSTLFETYPLYFNSAFRISCKKMEEKRNSLIKLKANTNNAKFNMDNFKRDEHVLLNEDKILME